ncbi:MAG: lipopolysaccharide heptosyltransferase family protein [Rhodospirillales bacterium]|nr:lipopolysaccharide heptosyltransferase family protein [Rhodospirillales bacterium]
MTGAGGAGPILVIKLGALGDFIQALGPFQAIRRHHARAPVTLLTTEPFADVARASPYFDDVWPVGRPRTPGAWLQLRRLLRDARFTRVYDLQTSDRSAFYFRLFWPGAYPEWSGIARGCSHPHANPGRDFMHTIERQAEQLRMAGIDDVPAPDLSWITTDAQRFRLLDRFALVAPGGAAHRPEKRWPQARYAALMKRLLEKNVTPVLIGGSEERALLRDLTKAVPAAIDLGGQTSITDLVALARRARGAVGNDTGPMHALAAAGCPTVVLYSSASDPALCAQRGPKVTILRKDRLADLAIKEVEAALGL